MTNKPLKPIPKTKTPQLTTPEDQVAAALREYHKLKSSGTASKSQKQPRWITFQQQYRSDPVALVHDIFDWGSNGPSVAEYQEDILTRMASNARYRLAVRGPHGLGKTAVDSWLVWWFALTREGRDWKIPTTASSWNQLTQYLWPEIHKWSRKLRFNKLGRSKLNQNSELLTQTIKLETGHAFAVTSDQAEFVEGAHADHLFILFDEAKVIPDKMFNAIEGAFSTPGEGLALANSTPGDMIGRFYDIHSGKPGYEDWDTLHVTLDMALKAGRISLQWVEDRKRQWGELSSLFQNRVLGQFAASAENGVIPMSWIQLAVDRYNACKGNFGDLERYALDVSGQGEDSCALAKIYSKGVGDIKLRNHESTMTTVGWLNNEMTHESAPAVIDSIGIGAGVYDRAIELGLDVSPFQSSNSARGLTDKSGELRFANLRAAAWWAFRERLDPDLGDGTILPPNKRLMEDLAAPRWAEMSNGSIVIESKKDLRKRYGRSPDAGDAAVMGLFTEDSMEINFF